MRTPWKTCVSLVSEILAEVCNVSYLLNLINHSRNTNSSSCPLLFVMVPKRKTNKKPNKTPKKTQSSLAIPSASHAG